MQFPADYGSKDVAGKEADFLVTMKKIEAQHLPTVDEGFIKALGIAAGSHDALRADVRKNLEREVKFRVLGRNKSAAMDALVKLAELEVPKSLVAAAARISLQGQRTWLNYRFGDNTWQEECWRLYDVIGELRFAALQRPEAGTSQRIGSE